MNEPFADIYCEKDGESYVISIKARNKFKKNGKLNTPCNLGDSVYQKAMISEERYKAIACWMAVQFDHNSFSIYFGKLIELNGEFQLTNVKKRKIGQTWVLNKNHYFDFDFYTNQEK